MPKFLYSYFVSSLLLLLLLKIKAYFLYYLRFIYNKILYEIIFLINQKKNKFYINEIKKNLTPHLFYKFNINKIFDII